MTGGSAQPMKHPGDVSSRERAEPLSTDPLINISALDHVHLYADDIASTAAWYERILGLKVLDASTRLKGRGLYLTTPRGQYCATLFTGKPPSDGDHTTAFRVPGTVFIAFGDALPHDEIVSRDGDLLQPDEADDHALAFSFYFSDPAGNHLEVTTYDHEKVRTWKAGLT